ncbi:c-type cytochrome [Albimonas pacifica]|uniref:Cytochrome c n=1 Tax=Albimonas pacifica TaxID=1114924 RepID=A0A1I3CQG4_9RHOB|nr:cytochrome C [Albimonas pacifica]SFH76469.1 cytochrome c [Albimonas pacifica]
MRTIAAFTILAAVSAAAPALAAGDAARGEKIFLKCRACHEIVAPGGEVVQRGGKVGPNLYGVIGRQAGSVEGFKGYSDSMKAAGEAGLTWDEATFTVYVQDPTAFLRETLDDASARGKMTFKLTSGMEDIYAYLVSVDADGAD